MYCISLDSTDPCFNLAVDEFLLRNSREEYFILGKNSRCVIIGKHQIPHRETDTKFVTENNIPVLRRISGGGTVFHDPGNLNFSFILNSSEGRQIDFRKYTLPVIGFLGSLGIEAKLEGKNDLRIGEYKISGNAEHIYKNRVLHHGTLLFNADLEQMKNSLRKDPGYYETRAVASNPSQVRNLVNMTKHINNIHDFGLSMMNWFLENNPGSKIYYPGDIETEEIRILCDAKYRSWEWNYAYGPEYKLSRSFEFRGVKSWCILHIRDGIIWECEITDSPELNAAVKNLIGCRHMVKDISEVLGKENIFKQGFDIYNFF